MKQILKLNIVAACLLIQVNLAFAQSENGCQDRLRQIFQREQEYQKQIIAAGKGCYLKYSLQSMAFNPSTEGYSPVLTEGELIATKNLRYMKTGSIEVFLDQNDVFTVNHQRKSVMRTRSAKEALELRNNPFFELLSDSAIKQYRQTTCQNVKEDGVEMTRYDIVSINKDKAPYLRVTIYVDQAGNFKKINADMNPRFGQKVLSYTFVIKERSSKEVDKHWFPVEKHMLSAGGKLRSPYNSYTYKEFIDNTFAQKNSKTK